MKPLRLVTLSLLLLFTAFSTTQAQTPDTSATDRPVYALPEVTIEATRAAETSRTAPVAVTIAQRSETEVALAPGLSLDDVLRPLSGIWVNDRHHFALGERISVRGMGYRSSFGVRGVQVIYDGIPLTLPDGQSFLDVVDPSVIRHTELVRTPASVFWGNGSGGVLLLSSQPEEARTFTRVRGQLGRYGQQQGLIESQFHAGRGGTVHAYASSVWQDGFRAHSDGRRTRWGANWRTPLGERTRMTLTIAGDQQDTENPSSLTREQFREDPTQARPAFVDVNAGKQSWQQQVGLTIDHEMREGTLSGTVYGLYRDLDNPLNYAFIHYDRWSGGTRLSFRRTVGHLEGGIGVDAALQRDARANYESTVDGAPSGPLTLDQVETVTSGSSFGYLRWNTTNRLALTGGLRIDGIRFEADDRLIDTPIESAAGDQSGDRSFTAWSPSAGLSYDIGSALVFAYYSTAFETPTTTELVNRPSGEGGFNDALDPQRTRGLEVGARGTWTSARLSYDIALFRQSIDDQIQQVGQTPQGRDVFGNIARSRHSGVELSATWQPVSVIEVAMRYTGNHFVLDETQDPDHEGNRVPGIPAHRGYAHLQAEQNGWWGRVSSEAVPNYYVDDANTEEAPGYVRVNVRVGHRGLSIGDAVVQPFASIDNLLDEQYAGSVVINAFGGRYYEPAPGTAYTIGLNLEL